MEPIARPKMTWPMSSDIARLARAGDRSRERRRLGGHAPRADDLSGARHLAEELVDVYEAGRMRRLRRGGGAVAHEHQVIVVHVDVAPGGLHTRVGRHTGEDHRLDAAAAQHEIQVGSVKAAVAV